MAIGRGSMTKELVGNRTKKMQMGGMVGRPRGQAIAAMAKHGGMDAQRPAGPSLPAAATPRIAGPITPMGRPMVGTMKKGGKVGGMRGCGCAKRGTKGGKMV